MSYRLIGAIVLVLGGAGGGWSAATYFRSSVVKCGAASTKLDESGLKTFLANPSLPMTGAKGY